MAHTHNFNIYFVYVPVQIHLALTSSCLESPGIFLRTSAKNGADSSSKCDQWSFFVSHLRQRRHCGWFYWDRTGRHPWNRVGQNITESKCIELNGPGPNEPNWIVLKRTELNRMYGIEPKRLYRIERNRCFLIEPSQPKQIEWYRTERNRTSTAENPTEPNWTKTFSERKQSKQNSGGKKTKAHNRIEPSQPERNIRI